MAEPIKNEKRSKQGRELVVILARLYPLIKLLLTIAIFILIFHTARNLKPLEWKLSTYFALILVSTPLGLAFGNCLTFLGSVLMVRAFNKSLNMSKYVITINGVPGAGKTSTAVYSAVLMALKCWFELKFLHWLNMGLKKRILASGDKDKIKRFYDIEEAYNFWKNTNCIPCLMSNTPLKARGRFACVLTMDYLQQNKKVPYMTVLLFDEIGSELGNEASKKKENFVGVSEFCRWCRHFGEFHIVSCEQDSGNVFINMRRVVAENRYMLSQEPILKPTFLLFIYKLLKWLFTFFNVSSFNNARFMHSFGKFINACGYRFYRYRTTGNSEAKIDQKGKRGIMVLPAPLNCEYDDHAYMNEYKAKDKILDLSVYESLIRQGKDNKAV